MPALTAQAKFEEFESLKKFSTFQNISLKLHNNLSNSSQKPSTVSKQLIGIQQNSVKTVTNECVVTNLLTDDL